MHKLCFGRNGDGNGGLALNIPCSLLACLPVLHRRNVRKLHFPNSLAARTLIKNMVVLIQIHLDEIWKVKVKRSKALGQPFLQQYQQQDQSQSLEHLLFSFSLWIWHRSGASPYRFSTFLSEAKGAAPQPGQFCRVVLELLLEA